MYRSLRPLAAMLGELRRRHVFKVAIVYGAVAWLIVEVAATVVPALHLPDWSLTLIVLLSILGFPVAVILAWAFDLTPQGIQRTPALAASALAGPSAPDAAPARPTAVPGPVTTTDSLCSLAVLPFVDRGPAGQHQYLGDGITEELISGLARVGGLRVVSRTSSFALRGAEVDVREVGARLGVGAVVEGSVRVSGDRLRLTVQLASVADGYTLWASTYERRMDDVFEVQEEVARAIVAALRERLSGDEDGAALRAPGDGDLVSRSTENVEAYGLYLRGRLHWNERTPAAIEKAIDYFRRAAQLDPGFAHAHAGIADGYALLMDYGVLAPQTALGAARESADRALRLGRDLAEAHTSLALVRQLEGDWEGAERAFRRALALNPGYVVARHRHALLLAWLGRFEQSRRELELARLQDPLSPVLAASLGWLEYYGGAPAAAVRIEQQVVAENPAFWTARVPLALALLQLERTAEAVAELKTAVTDSAAATSTLALLALALARDGQALEAREVRTRLQQRAGREYVSPYYLAVAALALGADDAALAELERAVDERAPQVAYLRVEPLFSRLRERAEFSALLRRAGLCAAADARR